MDMKAIRALAEIMKANDLTQVEITEEGKTIRMKREIAAVPVPAQTPFAPVMPALLYRYPKFSTRHRSRAWSLKARWWGCITHRQRPVQNLL